MNSELVPSRSRIVVLLAGAATVLVIGFVASKLLLPNSEPGAVDVATELRRLRRKYARRGFEVEVELPQHQKPIEQFPQGNAADAAIEANELVIGVTIDGESRAYPLNMLTGPTREVVNDTLGDRKIVVTWCNLCHHAMVFDRKVKDEVLTFAVSGSLHKKNLVLADTMTGSMWVQLTGKCEFGKHRGKKLTRIACSVETWGSWKEANPKGSAMTWSRSDNNYTKAMYEDSQYSFVIEHLDEKKRFAIGAEDSFHRGKLAGVGFVAVYDSNSTLAVAYQTERTLRREGAFIVSESGKKWHWRTGKSTDGSLDDLEPLTVWLTTERAFKAFHGRPSQP